MRSLLYFYLTILCACASTSFATDTRLVLRGGNAMRLTNGYTTQTLATTFGTNLLALGFSSTTNYDFYSPPMAEAVSLLTSDKGGGKIYMRNTSAAVSNDFSVTGGMQFYNYDPVAGTETLIVDTGISGGKDVNHGKSVSWAIPNVLLPSATVIPVGHMIHIRVVLNLLSGNPGDFGQLIYNDDPSSSGYLPQNRSQVLNWTVDTSAVINDPPEIIAYDLASDGARTLTGAGSAGVNYSVQATSDLASPSWTSIGTNITDANGVFHFTDQSTGNLYQFYRLLKQ